MSFAVRIHETGGPDVLCYEEVPVSDPGEGEVLLAQHAAGLNFIDTYHRSGYYPVVDLPVALGVEAAGVVVKVGAGVRRFREGDRVAYTASAPGAYAQHRVVNADVLVALPDEIGFDQAAAMMLKGMTARYLLRQTYPVQSGDTILVHAAAGGVGLILTQWAHYLGATVIGTVGSPEKAELARRNGCDFPLLYREDDIAARVREITSGEMVPVVYDSVGASTFETSLQCLRPRGLMVTFGQSSGPVSAFDPVLLSRNGSLFMTRPTLFHYIASPEELAQNSRELFSVVMDGHVSIPVRQKFDLSDAASAHRALESRQTTGSTVLLTHVS